MTLSNFSACENGVPADGLLHKLGGVGFEVANQSSVGVMVNLVRPSNIDRMIYSYVNQNDQAGGQYY